MTSVGTDQHTFRIAHAIHLIEVVKPWNVTGEELLAGSGLSRDALDNPRARMPVSTMVALLERARQLTGEPALGFHIGLHTRATLYGSLGFAVVTASTVREGIEAAIRFGPIVTTAMTMRFKVDRQYAYLVVDEHADFGSARDIVMMASLVALWQVSASLTGRDLRTSTAEFAFPSPSYRSRMQVGGLQMQFDRPVNQLRFSPASLDIPYMMPDPLAHKLAAEQCQSELEALGLGGGLTTRVRGLIVRSEGGCRGLEEVAAALNRSARTLKRQLGAQGVRFSTLRDDALRDRAQALLRSPQLSLAEIAARLGYSNVTNFERAFLRWTATTPAASRRAMDMAIRAPGSDAARPPDGASRGRPALDRATP
jgi:AraC-like DNA-binding protein